MSSVKFITHLPAILFEDDFRGIVLSDLVGW